MERHLVLLLGLLAWASAAATGAGAQPACEPSNLATQIALLCMPDMPTAPCCEPVVASVNLGGGVPCLCRVAAQPRLVLAGLNASHLLALYTACGGLRTEGAHLAASGCQGPSPPATDSVLAPPPPAAPRHKLRARTREAPKCNSSMLALRLEDQCTLQSAVPSPGCCSAVRDTVDDPDRDCLCNVGESSAFVEGSLDIYTVWTLYKTCGGRQEAVPKDKRNCTHAPAASPPPPPPPSSSPPPPHQQPLSPPPPEARRPAALSVGVLVGIVLGVVAGVVVMGVVSWLAYKSFVGVCAEWIAWICAPRATTVGIARSEPAPSHVVLPVVPPAPQQPAAHGSPPVAPTTSSSSSGDAPSSFSIADKASAKDLVDTDLVAKDTVSSLPFVPVVVD